MSIDEKYKAECLAEGFVYLGKSDRRNYSVVKCNVCGGVGEYVQGHIRAGKVRCNECQESKIREECSAEGFTWIEKVDKNRSRCSCNVCGHVDVFAQANIRAGNVRCKACQNTNYKSAAKDGWEFINHFCEERKTYVNLKHYCCDDLVEVDIGNYIKGKYSCPHCSHTHYNDQSYFYVIQVGDIIKLGISNRPDQRYTQYGLPEDSTIIEHLRIPLETKRDALVVESHAKQLVKDFKIPSDIAKQMFTKSGHNECYSIDALDLLLTI